MAQWRQSSDYRLLAHSIRIITISATFINPNNQLASSTLVTTTVTANSELICLDYHNL